VASERFERVMAALRGEPVDRVPVSAWWHDFGREWSAAELAEAALEAYRRYGWDFIKLNPRATYYAEAWGARFRPLPGRQPELLEPAWREPADLSRFAPIDPRTSAPFAEQLDALARVTGALAGEAPVVQTLFCPLAVLSRAAGGVEPVRRAMAEAPELLEGALGAVAETLAAYVAACLERGASGIFFATVEWGTSDTIGAEEHRRFARPYDLRVLEAAAGAPFTILHVCRERNLLFELLDYPAAAFHWASRSAGNPSLAEVQARTGAAVMGGVDHRRTMPSGTPEEVAGEAHDAIESTSGWRFLLAPECTVPPDTPPANLRALRTAAEG
jgi:uroporphyrinogen decarboxylase